MKVTLFGKPIPKSRPRFSKNGKVYNSQAKIMEEDAFFIGVQWNGPLYEGPVEIRSIFYMPIPKRLSKKDRAGLQGTPHIGHCDIDNLEKKLFDCIVKSGVIINDDCQIALSTSSKIWSDNPRTEFTILELPESNNAKLC